MYSTVNEICVTSILIVVNILLGIFGIHVLSISVKYIPKNECGM